MSLYGLKEWDAQTAALTRGDVSVLIRKGGIMETHDGFEVEHRSFLLYPTFLHQNPAELRPEFQPLLRPDPAPGTITLPALAEVVEVWRIEDEPRATALEGVQALTAAAISRRFHYRNRPWVHAVLLRVRPLKEPLSLPESPEMLGCVSWVPLGERLAEAAGGVVSEQRLQDVRQQLNHLLRPS